VFGRPRGEFKDNTYFLLTPELEFGKQGICLCAIVDDYSNVDLANLLTFLNVNA